MKSEPVTEPLLIGEVEAARLLAVHPNTLRNWRGAGLIPFLKIGAAVRYSPQALRAWITERQAGGTPR